MSKTRSTIYVAKELWQRFTRTCIREGESASRKIEGWIQSYMAAHGDGNPQTLLNYAEEVKTLPKYKTCIHSDRELHYGEFFCRRDAFWKIPDACGRCRNYAIEEETGK